ncbi:hypothetical protein BC834DRAFT_1035572 [Gloeopeniophorella convolvens]|nr:hypothetical protein BC834DRAFT_1035572 [Gloeopeniophorella convolvens]
MAADNTWVQPDPKRRDREKQTFATLCEHHAFLFRVQDSESKTHFDEQAPTETEKENIRGHIADGWKKHQKERTPSHYISLTFDPVYALWECNRRAARAPRTKRPSYNLQSLKIIVLRSDAVRERAKLGIELVSEDAGERSAYGLAYAFREVLVAKFVPGLAVVGVASYQQIEPSIPHWIPACLTSPDKTDKANPKVDNPTEGERFTDCVDRVATATRDSKEGACAVMLRFARALLDHETAPGQAQPVPAPETSDGTEDQAGNARRKRRRIGSPTQSISPESAAPLSIQAPEAQTGLHLENQEESPESEPESGGTSGSAAEPEIHRDVVHRVGSFPAEPQEGVQGQVQAVTASEAGEATPDADPPERPGRKRKRRRTDSITQSVDVEYTVTTSVQRSEARAKFYPVRRAESPRSKPRSVYMPEKPVEVEEHEDPARHMAVEPLQIDPQIVPQLGAALWDWSEKSRQMWAGYYSSPPQKRLEICINFYKKRVREDRPSEHA